MSDRCPYCGDSGRVIEPGRFSGDRSYSMTCDCVPRLPDQYQATLDAERAAREEADRLMSQPMDWDTGEAPEETPSDLCQSKEMRTIRAPLET